MGSNHMLMEFVRRIYSRWLGTRIPRSICVLKPRSGVARKSDSPRGCSADSLSAVSPTGSRQAPDWNVTVRLGTLTPSRFMGRLGRGSVLRRRCFGLRESAAPPGRAALTQALTLLGCLLAAFAARAGGDEVVQCAE